MLAIFLKEINLFFSSMIGYIAIIFYLIITGFFVWIYPGDNILHNGYADLYKLFELGPLVMLLLVPAITMRSFADEFDLGTIEFLLTKPLSDIVLEETVPGQSINSKEDLINYSKKMIKTNWHPVGTCKMGKDNDEMAVLNTKLEVKGIKNLRVFDVSMMPTIVGANTNAPAMAIADKATDLLLRSNH